MNLARPSARILLTLLTTVMALIAVFLIAEIVRQSLRDDYAEAIPDTLSAIWTVGMLLISICAIATWSLTGRVLQPMRELRRDLALAARTRALAEPHPLELSEIHALRTTMISVLEETETRLHEALAEQRRVLNLFEAISEGILQVDEDGRLLHVNAAARTLLQLPAAAEGNTAASLIRNLELRSVIERAARGESVAPIEVVVDARQLLIATGPLPAIRGVAGGAVITVVDLTELRRIESVRRDFVANVSHELKTPLTSIRGYAETLLTDDVPRDAQLQFLEVIHKNATRIHRIVDELLDLSRLQSGGWTPDLQPVEAADLARDVWVGCEENARDKDIELTVTGGPAWVTADAGGLRQVLSNLFENAIRYTPDGGQIRVTLRSTSTQAMKTIVEIEVRDDGVGIPGDALPRIFERFFRVDPARSREQGGTGLGLAIVKHLIERMNGEVAAESELGKGTSIKVRLPAARNT